MTVFARVISVLFHPLLLATYLFGLFALLYPLAFDPISEEGIWTFVGLLFSFTFVLPLLVLNLLRTLKKLPSFTMYERRERIIPFIFISICYTAITVIIYHHSRVSLNDNFFRILVVINSLVVVSTLVTFFYKASVHSIGIWGMVGILLLLNTVSDTTILFYPMIGCVLLAGIVMSSRLALQVHTLEEVLLGGTLGLTTSFVVMSLLFR